MTKFKVGDVVERAVTDAYCGLPSGEQGVVSKAVGNLVWIKGYGDWCHLAGSLRLAEQDDPLPPAPESGMYYSHNNDRRLTVLLEEGLPEDVIAVGTGASFLKVRLTAETALVLAHDLNRMANEIKRKEKQNA